MNDFHLLRSCICSLVPLMKVILSFPNKCLILIPPSLSLLPLNRNRNNLPLSYPNLSGRNSIYSGIKVQVESLKGERISQICWYTGSQSWYGGDRWNDWVWVTQRPGKCYGALNGCLLWQLQQLFKIKLLNEDGAFVEYWWALALTTIPENSGNLDHVSKFVQVRNGPAAVALQVFSMGNIVSCVHVIPEIATSSKTGDRQNER
jgi:hypothetical protein